MEGVCYLFLLFINLTCLSSQLHCELRLNTNALEKFVKTSTSRIGKKLVHMVSAPAV